MNRAMKTHPILILMTACLLFSLVLLSCDNDKITPGAAKDSADTHLAVPENTMKVETREVVRTYEAVGTIRPLTQSVIESQVSAQVLTVTCVPGETVKEGQVLVKLDARRLEARLQQAKEGLSVAKNNFQQAAKSVEEAKASLQQAKSTYLRTQKLFESDIVPPQQHEMDKAGYLRAKARLEGAKEAENGAESAIRQAKEIVNEAEIALGYTDITAPASGVAVQRMIDPGDLAVPGKPLLTIQTSGALRLEANVREGLIDEVVLGNEYDVRIKNISRTIPSTIDEIVPYADPATRTFLVKAALPGTPGIYPGMFGRLLIPAGKEKTLLIPGVAVIRVGQLEQTLVKRHDTWQRVHIKTGRVFEDNIEVLSGLNGDETIGYR